MLAKAKAFIKKNDALSKLAYVAIGSFGNFRNYLSQGTERKKYYAAIERIKAQKEIVVDIEYGGLGDWLGFSTLPRLLHKNYGIAFYLTPGSLERLRNLETLKLIFEANPYFYGIKESAEPFRFTIFAADKNCKAFLLDASNRNMVEELERQFSLPGRGCPEIYYTPRPRPDYADTVLVDKNYISGKKLGWNYRDSTFNREAEKYARGEMIEYADPAKQDLFAYADMIFGCRRFITTLSGGAALAACFNKPFSVVLPSNIAGGSVDNFVFHNSTACYIK